MYGIVRPGSEVVCLPDNCVSMVTCFSVKYMIKTGNLIIEFTRQHVGQPGTSGVDELLSALRNLGPLNNTPWVDTSEEPSGSGSRSGGSVEISCAEPAACLARPGPGPGDIDDDGDVQI